MDQTKLLLFTIGIINLQKRQEFFLFYTDEIPSYRKIRSRIVTNNGCDYKRKNKDTMVTVKPCYILL